MKNLIDMFKKCKRGAQIVTPKDASLILAYTGTPTDSMIVDAGSGSGFLAIFLAYYCPNGKVVTYEKRKEFAEIVRENIETTGLKNIELKEKDVLDGIEEKNIDLVTLDMKFAEIIVANAYDNLKPKGWLAVYSPYIEQVKKVLDEIKKQDFKEVKTIENITREWRSEHGFTRPKTKAVVHTGWLTFAKKT